MSSSNRRKLSHDVLLPDEILHEIFSALPIQSLVRCSAVCKSWRRLTKNPEYQEKIMNVPPICRINGHVFGKIFSRLPVTTLMLCRSACRSFRSHLSSPDFPNKLLPSCVLLHALDFYLYDLDAFPLCRQIKTKFRAISSFPIDGSKIIGSCNGFLCLSYKGEYYISNPLICDFLDAPKLPSNVRDDISFIFRGFGFSVASELYKLVLILSPKEALIWSVGVDQTWRHVLIENPIKTQEENSRGVYLNGKLHWISGQSNDFISSFDLETECFQEIPLPFNPGRRFFNVGVFEERLYIVSSRPARSEIIVWETKDDPVEKAWKQKAVINGRLARSIRLLKGTPKKQILLLHDNELKVYTPGWKSLCGIQYGLMEESERMTNSLEALEHMPSFVSVRAEITRG